ncbi:MAG: hypothetical protein ACFFER_06040 [Candidatus Thorarchaeota archaeon]
MLEFTTHQSTVLGDEFLSEMLLTAGLDGTEVLAKMYERVLWITVGNDYGFRRHSGSEFGAMMETGMYSLKDVNQFCVLRPDFEATFRVLLDVFMEAIRFPMVQVPVRLGRLAAHDAGPLKIHMGELAPDLVKEYTVLNVFGTHMSLDIVDPDGCVYVMDSNGQTTIIERRWDKRAKFDW